jgi:SecD/SecF fusion protein
VDSLASKGPQAASTSKYKWVEMEDQTPQSVYQWANPQGMGAIVGQFGKKYYVLASNLPGECLLYSPEKDWKLEKAQPSSDRMGRRAIGFSLNDKGAIIFGSLTENNKERPLCILLDDIAISAPNISTRIDKNGVITGSFTDTDVADMVNKLNAGSLPARLIEQPISVKNIGPSIGENNRDEGIQAGVIGLIVVILVMAVYYLKAGIIANLALVCNILFVLAIMSGLDATFTLPGIAGIILTIGMSVDANVLIFERIREEQAKGCSLGVAIKNGYDRAFRTIFDANLTTFITGAILYWVASEEIKGFAIVLMLGIVCSMFTALFVTRVVFDLLASKKMIQGEIKMLNLIGVPNINWMGSRPVFFAISSVLVISGLVIFFTRDSSKYDIEFTGGTAVQLNFKTVQNRDDVEKRLRAAGQAAGSPALETAYVYSVGDTGKEFEVTTTETNKTSATLTLGADATVDSVVKAIKNSQAGGKLSNLRVTPQSPAGTFEVATSQVNQELVKDVLTAAFPNAKALTEPTVNEIVNNTIENEFGDELEKQNDLALVSMKSERITEQLANENPMLANNVDGIKITCTFSHEATPAQINQRIKNLRFKPDMRDLAWYPYPHSLLGEDLTLLPADKPVKTFVYVSMPNEAGLRAITQEEWAQFEANETSKIKAAASLETSLPRVTQIDPSVGGEQQIRAIIAIILSLSAIVGYIWIRFGDLRYGLAAIIALVHDVCITLGAVAASFYLANYAFGSALLISDFKINLAMIAAFLTLIGYSLNDTIVVFDRIRENRHKAQLTPQTITNSINQTISRTLMTSFTTFVVVLVMYIFGGDGLRGFTFAIGLGVIVGTYSSIAIAAPVLLIGAKTDKNAG